MAAEPTAKAARPARTRLGPRGGVLANRDFAKLWAGESVSLIGTEVTTFTMPLVAVLTLNAPVFDVGALSYIPSLVEHRQLTDANSKIQGSIAVAGICGPGLAGLLIGLITAPVTLSVDAVSYLFSDLGLISISKPEPRPEKPAEPVSARQSITEGLRAVYGNNLLRILLSQSAILNMGFGALSTVFTVYAVRQLGLSPVKLGVTVAGLAVGALFGALSASRVRRVLGLGRALAVSIVAVSASPLLLLIPRSASLAAVLILFAGWLGHGRGISIWNVNTVTLRQVVTPQRVLARMNATYRMLLFGALPVGAIIGGLLGRVAGLRTALVISVFVLACPIFWTIFSPVFRLTQMPAGPGPDAALGTSKDG